MMKTEQEIVDEINLLVDMGLNDKFGAPWGKDHYAATFCMRALQWVLSPYKGEESPPISQVLGRK